MGFSVASGLILLPRTPAKLINPRRYEFKGVDQISARDKSIYEHEAVFIPDFYRPFVKNPPSLEGIAARFAGLRTLEQIAAFAATYGLLGVQQPLTGAERLSMVAPRYGPAPYEPLHVWESHIKEIRQLLLLYRALDRRKRGLESFIEPDLIEVEEDHGLLVAWSIEPETQTRFLPILLDSYESEEKTAFIVLAERIKAGLRDAINLDYLSVMETSNSRLGFRILEVRTTPYLLAAIYYDLWQIITDNRAIIACENCGLPLERSGRKRFCNNACRQAAYRKRKNRLKEGS